MTTPALSAFAAEFDGTAVSIVDHAGHKWPTAADVGLCLGYAADTARQAIIKLFNRHRDEFSDEDTFEVKLTSNSRGNPNTRIFSATGCVKLGFFANTAKAKAFRAWASRVLAGHIQSAPASNAPAGRRPRVDRSLEREVLERFASGWRQSDIAKSTGASPATVNLLLHGKYQFAAGAGPTQCPPELLEAVAENMLRQEAERIEAHRERLAQRYLCSAHNQELAAALDTAGRRLLGLLR